MTPDEYCQEKAAKSGSSFYYSFLFLPPERRKAITALYAFCREVDDIADECTDIVVATTKLAWWEAEIKRAFDGSPQHPVSQALQPAIKAYDLPQELFIEIIDGMRMDLGEVRYADLKSLQLYCYRVASVVGQLSASIFGYSDRQTLKYANDLGMAFQLTNIIRDVGEDARRDRIYLPQDEMRQYGVTENDILQGKQTEQFASLMAFQAQRAQQYYESAFAALPKADRKNQLTGLIMAAIYRSLLDEISRDNYQVLNQRISLTPIRKLWLAIKTWLRG